MVKTSLLKLLSFYQRFISVIGFGSCRYYPSCSEYAKWQFEQNPLHKAFYHSFIRILRCNQLFPGGIDYPLADKICIKPKKMGIDAIKYWLVPNQHNHFHIIKNFTYKGS